jgi:hypothetical protein
MAYDTEPAVTEHPSRQVKRRTAAQTKKLLKTARDRFKQAQSAEAKQRQRELDDLRFYAGEQWPEDIKTSRAGQAASNGLPPVPARPCITINKTREPVRTVLNQERGSDMGIEIVPADDFGELIEPIPDTEIKLREGLVRRIQRESQAADARTWAFARAVQAGRGYYGVMTRYVAGKTNDQEIYVQRFFNQACVTLDPAREQPDGSDAEFGFIGSDIPWDRYRIEHPRRNGKPNALASESMTEDAWRQLGEEQPEWFIGEGDARAVRVVDYFYTVRTGRTLCTLADESLAWADELPEGAEVVDEREVIEKSIKWAKIDGSDDDVLDETDWPGPDMPIIQVLGEELQPYDAEKRAEGMVRPMREPGQSYNVMVSKMVELIGLTPIPPLMVAEGQVETYEAWYQAANTRTLPYLPYKQTDLENRPAPPPFSTPRQPQIEPVVTAVAMFDDALQAVSVSDPASGHTDSSVKSAKHASLLREQARQGTSNYLDNLQRSMRYEAQVINNLLYPIYGRPGRIARILNGQGEPETLLLHQPMIQQGGKPMQAPADAQDAKTYTLTKDAKFNAIIKITKNYDSRREQEAEIAGELIGNAPGMLNVIGDMYLKNLDGPGHDEMADRMKVMLDPKVLQYLESKKSGQDVPPQVLAQIAQKDQQLQELQQIAQQMQQQIQTDAVKEQAETARKERELAADLQKAQVEADVKIRIAAMEQETAIRLEEIKIRGLQMQAEIDAAEAQRAEMAAGRQQASDQAHEAGMAAMDQTAASESQASDQDHAAAMQADAQRAAAEQAAMAAQQQESGA